MPSPIEFLDDTLMQYILRFLSGPSPESIDTYTAVLRRCERVCKWFHRIVADDRLWGYWSVQGQAIDAASKKVYLTVPEYGPHCEDYDKRFQTWRDLAQCKAAIQRMPRITNEYSDAKVYGFREGAIQHILARNIFDTLHGDFYESDLSLELREDSAQMLFTLAGKYLEQLFEKAMRLLIFAHKAELSQGYPTVDARTLEHVFLEANNQHHPFTLVPVRFRMALPQAETSEFDTFIRRIAYRAGTVKLDNSAFETAKTVYFERLRDLLRYACIPIISDGFDSDLEEEPRLSTAADAFYIYPGLRRQVVFEPGAQPVQKLTWVVTPVPAQFEEATQRLSNTFVKPRVYGVEATTMRLANLDQYYDIESDYEVQDDDNDDDSYFEQDDNDDSSEDGDFESGILHSLDMISEQLDEVKAAVLENGTLNHESVAVLISDLQELLK